MNTSMKIAKARRLPLVLLYAAVLSSLALTGNQALAAKCRPTPWDEIGPFYRPNAPVRSSIGKGYLLSGTVRSSRDCSPISGARIEIWQTGPGGQYDETHRATLFADRQGRYRIETVAPRGYGQRPSHIHLLVDAKGFEGLITQHYPKQGAKKESFDLVLVPESKEGAKPGGRVDDLVRPGKLQPGKR